MSDYIVKDKELEKLLRLIDKDSEFEVFPEMPEDSDEMIADTKKAMERLSKEGKPFWEETKMKFTILEKVKKKLKQKTIHELV